MYNSNALKLTHQKSGVGESIVRGFLTTGDGDDDDDDNDKNNDVNAEVTNEVELLEAIPGKKPHFLDYDIASPQHRQRTEIQHRQQITSQRPDLIEHFDSALRFKNTNNTISSTLNNGSNSNSLNGIEIRNNAGEEIKIAKKFERDGEISDFELAASGYTKKEFTQDDNTLELDVTNKKACKHFLDENPIPPPDGIYPEEKFNENHQHRRHNEQKSIVNIARGLTVERYNDSSAIRTPKCLDLQANYESGGYTNFDIDSDKLDVLGQKVECVYSLLSMLGSNDPLEMARKFHELSRNSDTCITLRRSGCIPLLIQMIYAEGSGDEVRKWAGMALHNVVHSHPDEKAGRREAKVLRLLDQIMDYCSFLRTLLQSGGEAIADDADRHPLAAISSLMKVSFDEEHRHAMCDLGALHGIPNLVYLDHAAHGPKPESSCCNSLRRFALMALTNLTFGDENNKALLCSQKLFMEALITQLDSTPDDLLQVTASVLRNLSWRADAQMKAVLNEIGTVTALTNAAMKNKCENTLKAILSALWNLSAHCSTNKAEFCAVDGALSFLVKMLNYDTLKIVENAGGILRNVSSHIAVREDYRQILRDHNCLMILLQQLKSESLTVVSNSCGTLWNLSARCPQDQRFLWDNGAVPMLRSLINSKHAMIREGSACALKNLLNFRPSTPNTIQIDPIARSLNLKKLPTLNVRKQKALEQELGVNGHTLTETCDNLDTSTITERSTYNAAVLLTKSRPSRYPLTGPLGVIPVINGRLTRSAVLSKSESRDSIFSAKSDTGAYDHLMRSHSATETNRKLQHIATSNVRSFALKNDVEPNDDQPIDYAAKYKENGIKQDEHKMPVTPSMTESSYQETDIDQPTDFSLRYAESQVENYLDEANQVERVKTSISVKEPIASVRNNPAGSSDSEIILILEDSVKCYQTEDTPYVISNAPSITDLRSTECAKKIDESHNIPITETKKMGGKKFSKNYPQNGNSANTYGSRSYTPEKPVNYCEEGTPGYFSRYESLSSLDEAGQSLKRDAVVKAPTDESDETKLLTINDENAANKFSEDAQQQSPTPAKINSALETPLMYSRRSSIDSLAEEDVEPIDDKSSVVSEFSRLASGIISPSEIPDSPTQGMPLSPRRNNESNVRSSSAYFLTGISSVQCSQSDEQTESQTNNKHFARSVFEDDLNTFHVENTPAQFSTATSLSNLSILDEESSSHATNNNNNNNNNSINIIKQNSLTVNAVISENDEEEEEEKVEEEEDDDDENECNNKNDDDLLLATCINIGMNRVVDTKTHRATKEASTTLSPEVAQEIPKRYCTEDTPALLSKVGSKTNLSTISLYSNSNNCSSKYNGGIKSVPSNDNERIAQRHISPSTRHSLNLSDDMSSNASESGATSNNFDILQQCIRDGMQKSITSKKSQHHHSVHNDPIAKMRKGGNILPPYLANYDETNKYHTEDSPCNFSVTSGLSNLTVGSSLVGPAIKLGNNNFEQNISKKEPVNAEAQDDSLSSLSIESEDDNNLLHQAIAAGCNRPKSNLGFSTTITSSGRHTTAPLTALQTTCLKTTSSSGGIFVSNVVNLQQQQQQQQQKYPWKQHNSQPENDSDSSTNSSDSNDNQSKSLLELCILTGMHKTPDNGTKPMNFPLKPKSHKKRTKHSTNADVAGRCHSMQNSTTRSNPNLQQYDSLCIDERYKQTNRHLLEQEKRDEKLLMECIKTGIMKKIGEAPKNKLYQQTQQDQRTLSQPITLTSICDNVILNGQPKNGQATSVAAQQQQMKPIIHPTTFITTDVNIIPNTIVSGTIASTANISTITTTSTTIITPPTIIAASDVEKNSGNTTINTQHMMNNHYHNYNYKQHNINSITSNSNSNSSNNCNPINHHVDIAEDVKKSSVLNSLISPIHKQKLPNLGSKQHETSTTPTLTNIIHVESCFNANRADTVINKEQPNEIIVSNKHKDPDLMLKSVERLTMEFVSSAEQLRNNTQNIKHHVIEAESNNINDSNVNQFIKQMMMKNDYVESSPLATNSTNTWNEDNSYPNNVSFPSISVTAPKITSLSQNNTDNDTDEDHTADDYKKLADLTENVNLKTCLASSDDNNEGKKTENSIVMMNNNEDEIFVNDLNNRIHFQLGGEVQTAAATSTFHCNNNNSNNNLNNNCHNSCITNSTFLGQETQKFAANFQTFSAINYDNDDNENMTFSMNSIDLDNIRPPSGMNSLNISGYYQDVTMNADGADGSITIINDANDSMNSLPKGCRISCNQQQQLCSKSPKLPRKALPIGFVARRALGHMPSHVSGSAESVISSCNIMLDNIKPPSLMDELLDSMVSVSSIQSEVVEDCPSLATTITTSNYETANPDGDYRTTALQNYVDDDCTLNDTDSTSLPLENDYSSTESIANKSSNLDSSKLSLTPKQKRKLSKDRFKTYTIKSDCHNDTMNSGDFQQFSFDNEMQQDETLSVEVIEHNNMNNERNESQGNIINSTANVKIINKSRPINRRRSSQDRYKTQTILFPLTVINQTQSNDNINNPIKVDESNSLTSEKKIESDMSSLDFYQNSETESSHDLNVNNLTDDDIKSKINMNDITITTVANAITTIVATAAPTSQQLACNKNINSTTRINAENPITEVKKSKYVSPYSKYNRNSKQITSKNSANNGNPLKTFDQGNKTKSSIKTNSMPQKKAITENIATMQSSDAIIQRQGTFIKEKPETMNCASIPVVEIGPPSKLPTKQHQPIDKINNNNNQKKYTHKPINLNIAKKRLPLPTQHTKPQRANSNVTMRSNVNVNRHNALASRISTTTPPSRSNSSIGNTPTSNAAKISQNSANGVKTTPIQSRPGFNRKICVSKNTTGSLIKQNNTNTKATAARQHQHSSPTSPMSPRTPTITGNMKPSKSFNSGEVLKTSISTNTKSVTTAKSTMPRNSRTVSASSSNCNIKNIAGIRAKTVISKK